LCSLSPPTPFAVSCRSWVSVCIPSGAMGIMWWNYRLVRKSVTLLQ
jgi:hypothetical protein